MLSKNAILGIIAGVGAIMSVTGGALSGAEAAILLVLLTVSVLAGVFFFYENPKGQVCTPKKDDANVATWITNDVGKCVANTCVSGYVVIDGKCVVPTDVPKGWDAKMVSNTFSNTSNLISGPTASDFNMCGYQCRDVKACNVAAFSVKNGMCSLYSHDDHNDNDPAKDGDPVKLLKRPAKK